MWNPTYSAYFMFCSISCTVSQRETPSLILCFWLMRRAKRNKPWGRKHMLFRTQHVSFFVTFNKANWLDGYHVVFGELVEGDDVLAKNWRVWIKRRTHKKAYYNWRFRKCINISIRYLSNIREKVLYKWSLKYQIWSTLDYSCVRFWAEIVCYCNTCIN